MKYLITLPALCVVLIILALVKAANAHAERHTVEGVLAGIAVHTTVDSPYAKALLEAPRSAHVAEPWPGCQSLQDVPTAEALTALSRKYSPDTATALLIRCLGEIPEIARAQRLFLDNVAAARADFSALAEKLAPHRDDYLLLFVPGWGYRENGAETGADLRRPRELMSEMGFTNVLVPLLDNGGVEENAAILSAALREALASNKRVVLVSASSGGPTVVASLTEPDIAGHAGLAGWLNICGVLNGSPVIDAFTHWSRAWLLRLVSMFEGWRYPDLLSLSRSQSASRYRRFHAPPQLTIVNYVGIPFSGQVSDEGRFFYNLLKKQGPNDGLTLITEAMAPGYTVLAVGSDHFINEDPAIDRKTLALLPVMLELIDEEQQLAALTAPAQ
ncbi:MAG: hypothetical protein HKN19_13000 [Halioglobus sp.]|nr:hypothetical protein [Halioglobus sp.]